MILKLYGQKKKKIPQEEASTFGCIISKIILDELHQNRC